MQAGLGVEEAVEEVHQAAESEDEADNGQNAEKSLGKRYLGSETSRDYHLP